MPGQEHTGPGKQLPAGGLPKDEPCQSPIFLLIKHQPVQEAPPGLSTEPRRPRGAPGGRGHPGRSTGGKTLLPIAKHGCVVTDLTPRRPVWSHSNSGTPPAPMGKRSSSRGCYGAGRQFCEGLCYLEGGKTATRKSPRAREGTQRGAGRAGEAAGEVPAWQLRA